MKYLNTRYTLMQASYWGVFGALSGYAALYLDSKGFTAGQTGILMAIASIIAAALQPAIAAKADRGGKIGLKELTISLAVITALGSLLLCFTGMDFWIVAVLFCIALLSSQILQPLVNSVSMYYLNRGEKINFGLARGIGSVAYAGVSYIIGTLSGKVGGIVVPATAAVLCVAFLAMAFSFRIEKQPVGAGKKAVQKQGGFLSLLLQNKGFAMVLLGIIFMFVYHFMTNTYMFQMMEAVDGDSQNMGTAISIAAVCEIPIMVFFSRIAERIPVKRLLRITGIGWTVKAVTVCFCTSVAGIYANQVLQIVAFGLYVPVSVYYANQTMKECDKVKGQALVTMAFTIGSVFGNLLGGKLIDLSGVQLMLSVGAVCAAIGAVLFFIGTYERKTTE